MKDLPTPPPLPAPRINIIEHVIYRASEMRERDAYWMARIEEAVRQERGRILAAVTPEMVDSVAADAPNGDLGYGNLYFPATAHQQDMHSFARAIVAAAIRPQE